MTARRGERCSSQAPSSRPSAPVGPAPALLHLHPGAPQVAEGLRVLSVRIGDHVRLARRLQYNAVQRRVGGGRQERVVVGRQTGGRGVSSRLPARSRPMCPPPPPTAAPRSLQYRPPPPAPHLRRHPRAVLDCLLRKGPVILKHPLLDLVGAGGRAGGRVGGSFWVGERVDQQRARRCDRAARASPPGAPPPIRVGPCTVPRPRYPPWLGPATAQCLATLSGGFPVPPLHLDKQDLKRVQADAVQVVLAIRVGAAGEGRGGEVCGR